MESKAWNYVFAAVRDVFCSFATPNLGKGGVGYVMIAGHNKKRTAEQPQKPH